MMYKTTKTGPTDDATSSSHRSQMGSVCVPLLVGGTPVTCNNRREAPFISAKPVKFILLIIFSVFVTFLAKLW